MKLGVMTYPISSALAIYFVLWWIVLFAVLPFGVRNQDEAGDVTRAPNPARRVAYMLQGDLDDDGVRRDLRVGPLLRLLRRSAADHHVPI